MDSKYTSRIDIELIHNSFTRFKNEISTWIYGQSELVELLMVGL